MEALAVVAIVVVVSVGAALIWSDRQAESEPSDSGFMTRAVSYREDAGPKDVEVLRWGGLIVRASCIDYGQGRKYLSVVAKTKIDNAARATVMTQRKGGQSQTYSFKSSDFDRSFGWYDVLGTNPSNTTGTFAYARPNGDQVSLTYRADEHSDGVDCLFEGTAVRQLNQPGSEPLPHLELYGGAS